MTEAELFRAAMALETTSHVVRDDVEKLRHENRQLNELRQRYLVDLIKLNNEVSKLKSLLREADGAIDVLQQLWRGSDGWWEWKDVPIVEEGK